MEKDRVRGVHHVVWCVEPASLPRVRAIWEQALGVRLEEIDLPELGLRVLISWAAGVEIMAPAHPSGAMVEAARRFLAERGEGVYSVVFDVEGLEGLVPALSAAGPGLLFRDGISAEEVAARRLAPGERFSIEQAGFEDCCGMRLCLQEIRPA